ncbi:hypothetical protein LWI28_009534 [Acer negundo]|uniref:Uncharacterized protein n=1 Tax=Acer negundo TaxID=4023 RepID=A0AAD5JG72_ACENE|nr:hypothetical protein LWI28_009534 [Acer negundo]
MDYFAFTMEKRGVATADLTKTFSSNLDTGKRSVRTAAPLGDADNADIGLVKPTHTTSVSRVDCANMMEAPLMKA